MLTERHHEILRDWRDDLRSGRVFAHDLGGAGPAMDCRRKLSDDAVRAIRADSAAADVIAKDWGVSRALVYAIKARTARANVADIPEAAE